ncbi:MAG: ABC transporter permease [Bacteroides sp.]|nr:ABC transporter permease [Roseburia sp.]MCM1347568.1 ABC transporter permease [Bacteroides sp.]MCM1421198.1 ABC transporter permease [Bacteroides sp.]
MKNYIRFDSDQWGEIFDSLSRNKTRSVLTAFGIFWGIFMLVLLIGGGKGMESTLAQNFAGFATNSGFIGANNTSVPYKGFKKGRRWNLEISDMERVRATVPEVEVVTASVSNWGTQARYHTKAMSVTVKGVYPEYSLIDNPKIIYGRDLNDMDIAEKRKVCVIGKRIAEEFFSDSLTNVCGHFIEVDGIYYQVAGISGLSGSGMNISGNALTTVTIPFTTMQQAYNRGKVVDMLCFTARPGFKVSEVQDKIEEIIKRNHFISPDDSQAVIKVNAEAIFGMIENLFGGISILIWMIGLGTLLSGSIGVSNIMMVTVRERTSEIGIRRAIGATPLDIMIQIISESMVLTLLAGMSGITLAVVSLQGIESMVRDNMSEANFQITFELAVSAALLLSLLGIIAGLAPAYRAMSIKPVEAMRDE